MILSVALELTAPNVCIGCRHPDCNEHYVVRADGVWLRGFHNERDALLFAEETRLDEPGAKRPPVDIVDLMANSFSSGMALGRKLGRKEAEGAV